MKYSTHFISGIGSNSFNAQADFNLSLLMKPTFFAKPADFRKWLEKNHRKETELLVGFYKVGSGKPSITWPESVDEALCFGWIDGVRKSIDEYSYTIRFTPRKTTSIWSAINIKKMETLIKEGRMREAGLESFKHRKEHKSKIYAYESEAKKLSSAYEKKFKANKKAWEFFNAQSAYYKKRIIHRIMTAKQEVTQLKRLEEIITLSTKSKRLP
jgi:uncharacterized protein YdeI (YjbR/CyaY-like superfamily)